VWRQIAVQQHQQPDGCAAWDGERWGGTFTVVNGSNQTMRTPVTSSALTNGSASVSYSLPANTPGGVYTIRAVYNASANFATSSDSSHTLTINTPPSPACRLGIAVDHHWHELRVYTGHEQRADQ
jgi:Bacterial Ig-like domain (group 3)